MAGASARRAVRKVLRSAGFEIVMGRVGDAEAS
jgi:hypothetical protein